MKEPKSGEQPPEAKPELSPGDKKMLDKSFENYFLDDDVGNSLMTASIFAGLGQFEMIQPIQTYEEYLHEVADRRPHPENGAYYNYIMDRSDPQRVAQYNEMVTAFNNNLENIKREKDRKKVQDFVQKANGFLTIRRKED